MEKVQKVLLSEMTWDEVKEAVKEKRIAIIPIGSTEQHGFHLPLDTDTFLCYEVAKEVAKRFAKVVIVPPLPFGRSSHHMAFPGTISLRPATFINLIVDVCLSLAEHGFTKMLILNGHGGNIDAVSTAAGYAKDKIKKKVFMATATYFQFAKKEVTRVRESPLGGMAHACEFETSLQLFLRPELVKVDKMERSIPRAPIKNFISWDLLEPSVVKLIVDTHDISPQSGVAGDPTVASKEKGKAIFDAIVQEISKFLEEFYKL